MSRPGVDAMPSSGWMDLRLLTSSLDVSTSLSVNKAEPSLEVVVHGPAVVFSDERAAPLAEGVEGQRRVDTERHGDDGAVGNIQPLVHLRPLRRSGFFPGSVD